TGGWVVNSDDVFEEEIRKQVKIAIDEADLILFLVEWTGHCPARPRWPLSPPAPLPSGTGQPAIGTACHRNSLSGHPAARRRDGL
ncbi:MAG: hypothetical protein K6C33_09850, partial [Desulfovibrio sp.]|nr:hypothetical protein [Desulfovibrio sp.]